MSIFTKRILMISILTLMSVGIASAQSNYYVEPRLQVNGPAVITGPKQFNWSQNPIYTTPWGRPIDTAYYNVPVAKAYDELGELPLTNGTGSFPSLVGKFALILRGGGVTFSQKAYYCQQAGAIGVIIVNHKNGGTIGMAPTTPFSTNTTIPVLMISREDGFPINDALKNGQAVTINLSGWGFKFNNDLGFVDYSPATPHAFCLPLSQVNTGTGTPRAYNFYTGAYVANFGTAAQTNVKMKQVLSFTPTGGSSSVIYTDSVVSANFPTLDSIQELFSNRFTRQNFTSTGTLNIDYTVGSSATDQNPSDNSARYQLKITDSIFCKGRWDDVRNAPLVSSSSRWAADQPLVWGPLFYVTKGGYRPVKAQLAIAGDSDLFSSNTPSPSVLVYLYKWKDNNTDGLVNGNELSIVALGYRSNFAATDSSNKPFTVDLTNAKNNKLISRLESNTWYFLAAEVEHSFALGTDNYSNFATRNVLSIHKDSAVGTFPEFWAPNTSENINSPYSVSTDTLANIPYINKSVTSAERVKFTDLTGLVPAMALHISKDIPTGIEIESLSNVTNLTIAPNPASESVNVSVTLNQPSNMVLSVVSSVGQSLAFITRKGVSTEVFSLNTRSYPAGTYYLVIGTDSGSEAKQFVIAR